MRSRAWRACEPRVADGSEPTTARPEDALVVVSRGREARLRASSARTRARPGAPGAASWTRPSACWRPRSAKLADAGFCASAPAPVVDGVRARDGELEERVARLREHGAG